MAGIGLKLNWIFGKRTILSSVLGVGYSAGVTIAPMAVIIGNVLLMGKVLGFDRLGYAGRELFSCTLLYIFIFSLLTTAPFNAVLSRYLSDVIYEERYADILPCFYVGLLLNVVFSALFGMTKLKIQTNGFDKITTFRADVQARSERKWSSRPDGDHDREYDGRGARRVSG